MHFHFENQFCQFPLISNVSPVKNPIIHQEAKTFNGVDLGYKLLVIPKPSILIVSSSVTCIATTSAGVFITHYSNTICFYLLVQQYLRYGQHGCGVSITFTNFKSNSLRSLMYCSTFSSTGSMIKASLPFC